MKRFLSALAAFACMSAASTASADTLGACHQNFPNLKLMHVTSATALANDFRLTVNGQTRTVPIDDTEEESVRIAINGDYISLYADASGNLYGPLITGNDVEPYYTEAERASHDCFKLYPAAPDTDNGISRTIGLY